MLKAILDNKEESLYSLEKRTGVAHSSLNDIYNERTKIENVSIGLADQVAKALNMSLDDFYSIMKYDDLSLFSSDIEFDLFKSNVCQELKALKKKRFLKKHLENNTVEKYFNIGEFEKSLYMLSMIDYVSNCEHKALPDQYENIRKMKLNKISVPTSLYIMMKNKQINYSSESKKFIKEFYIHNIVEAEIDDVA